jgi:tripartite-type tricarboxylate transporter receptor subunit TctC
MIVPFGSGGGMDSLSRTLQPALEEALGVSIAIVNTPGAGGRRGTIELFRSEPDGYTIGLSYFVPFIVDQHVLNREVPIDLSEFEVIQRSSVQNVFMYVASNSEFADFEALANADRPIRIATTGIGSIAWVAGEILSNMAGFETVYIPGYSNLGEAALAVARGDADASFGAPGHFEGQGDDVRTVVFVGEERNADFPDTPTVGEFGYGDAAQFAVVHVFSAPPGTDPEQVEVLSEAFLEAFQSEAFVTYARNQAMVIEPGDKAEVMEYRENLGATLDSVEFDLSE